MIVRGAGWACVVLTLGLMAAIATSFQLTIPRLHAQWIGDAVEQHNLILQGNAGTPWQYRPLSDYLIQGVFNVLIALNNRNPYLYGFALFRGAQAVGIFALGFVFFRKLGLSTLSSVVGLAVVCTAMVLGQLETNWRLDAYTEVVLYLLAGIVVLWRRFALVIPLAVLAALNRESGVLIAAMPLACVDLRSPRSAQSMSAFRAAGIALVLFIGIRLALLLGLPAQDASMRVVTDQLLGDSRIKDAYVYPAIVVASIPFFGALGIHAGSGLVRYLFWLIVPAWIVAHWWGNLVMTPLTFLVPLSLVLVPSALLMAEMLWRKNAGRLVPAVTRRAALPWETLAALTVVYLLGPVAAGVAQLTYPFPLARFDSAVLQEVRRAALGYPLYVAPTLDYVPLVYPPLYFYVSAGIAALTGVGFLPLRAVSFAAALGSAFLVYALVSRDAPGRLAGFVAAGLYLGATQLTPSDLYPSRVDGLSLLLLLGAITAARLADCYPSRAGRLSVLCGLLVGLAILTKQTAVVVGLALLLVGIPRWRARVLAYVLGAAGTLAVASALLLVSSGGWARFYLGDLPRNHGLLWSMLTGFWTLFVLPHFGIALLFAAAFFVLRACRGDYEIVRFYALATGGLIAMSWVGVLNPGGSANTLLAAYAGLAILLGLGLEACIELARRRFPQSHALPLGLSAAAALALATLQYGDDHPPPLRANALAGQRLVSAMAALPGRVFAPDLGEFQLRAGKGDQAFTAAWQELLGDYGGSVMPTGREFQASLDQALSSHAYPNVVLDPEGFDTQMPLVLESYGYERVGPLFGDNDPFFRWRLGRNSGGAWFTPSPDLYAPRAQQ